MGIATAGTIGRSFDAYEAVTGISGKYHNVRMAMNRMARDISSFTAPVQKVRDEDRQWKTIFKGGMNVFDDDFHSFLTEYCFKMRKSPTNEITYFGKSRGRLQNNLMRREDWRPTTNRERWRIY